VTADDLADLDAAFRRDVEHLHRLGPRAVGELLIELGARRMVRTEIELLLRRYRRLDPAIVAAVGGRWWQ
jgi:hypothetical protein